MRRKSRRCLRSKNTSATTNKDANNGECGVLEPGIMAALITVAVLSLPVTKFGT